MIQQQYTPPPPKPVHTQPILAYKGNGGTLFRIMLVNMLLTMVTLGFYYPWAKAKTLQYLYNATELDNSRFAFHGTGAEMFKGFLKAIGCIAVIIAVVVACVLAHLQIVGIVIYAIAIFTLAPFVIHGAFRYRMSRTTWRAIRFGYRGNLSAFVKLFMVEMLLTICTFGFYASWMTIKLRNYVLSNVRFGSGEFQYKGDGWDYFALNMKGMLLSMVTFGIYSFWWQAELFQYYVDNLRLVQGERSFTLRSKATGGAFAKMIILNTLLVICTLGLGFAWAQTNTLTFLMNNVHIEGDIDLASLEQTEEEYKNALGEDMADMFDISFI
ncbi:YjgN family protein [Chitinophaga nivalis]|uniref:YjgN family protein n=1 Tax=Chitinophaga nivalis TaxID=2991709 RepID=A0ABT3IPK5_9BACT|nr:YjgN family protein [Chitinophaga nivalis]MCW3464427.1 YjgN family protein [Chitinophaga nivalis]MCW3485882.1 YjgN family protein [Chitinophaga nivalis]